jgi:hypothetical protein
MPREVIVTADVSKDPGARRALELLLEASETGDPPTFSLRPIGW